MAGKGQRVVLLKRGRFFLVIEVSSAKLSYSKPFCLLPWLHSQTVWFTFTFSLSTGLVTCVEPDIFPCSKAAPMPFKFSTESQREL